MMEVKRPQEPMRHRKQTHHSTQSTLVRVWDMPTRLFHWMLVILMVFSWYSADQGYMDVHLWSGCIFLTLLLFRISWGFLGSTTARFSNFLQLPPKVMDYLKALFGNNKPLYAGHNPAGGLMVIVLISTLLTQTITGLFSNDGVRFHGPLALSVTLDMSDRLTELHGIIFNGILILVWLHLVAIFFYWLVKGENLIKPMVTGYKYRDHLPKQLNLSFTHWNVALIVLSVAAGIVGWILLL